MTFGKLVTLVRCRKKILRHFITALIVLMGLVSPSTVYAQAFPCTAGNEYSINQTSRVLSRINPVTGASSTIGTIDLPPGGGGRTRINGMGLPPGGGNVIYAVVSRGPPDNLKGAVASFAPPGTTSYSPPPSRVDIGLYAGGANGGAVNPADNHFYYTLPRTPTATNTVWGLFSYNPATPSRAPIRIGEVTGAAGNNGDIAFDGLGNLYLLSGNADTYFRVYRVAGPFGATSNGAALPATAITPAFTSRGNYGGIAFDNGLLTLQVGGTYTRRNPATGELVGGTATGFVGSDLASCMYPNTLRFQKSLPRGRFAAGDQFTLAITGGGITASNTATTAGTAPGIQPQIVGPVLVQDAAVYTVTETPSGTTDLTKYDSRWECLDGATVVSDGTGSSGTLTIPPNADIDANVVCTIVNGPLADLQIAKTNTIALGKSDLPSDTVSPGPTIYTLTVTNAGPWPVTGAIVRDTPGEGITCPGANAVTIVLDSKAQPASTITVLTGDGVTLGLLDPGKSATLTFQCTVN